MITPHTHTHIVVQIYSGIPVLAEAYSDEPRAIDHTDELKAETKPEYEVVDMFPAQLK